MELDLESEWFGLAGTREATNCSIVSLYDRALSEAEFIRLPMLYRENSDGERKAIKSEYFSFFEKFIRPCRKVDWIRMQTEAAPVIDIEDELENFLSEAQLGTYIDPNSGTIFQTDSYMEILVYSTNAFWLPQFSRLKQRVKNTPILWEETNWGR